MVPPANQSLILNKMFVSHNQSKEEPPFRHTPSLPQPPRRASVDVVSQSSVLPVSFNLTNDVSDCSTDPTNHAVPSPAVRVCAVLS